VIWLHRVSDFVGQRRKRNSKNRRRSSGARRR
jgi:hypothetical protein